MTIASPSAFLCVDRRLVSVQKRRWNDLLISDMKKCDLPTDWRNMAHERGIWRGFVKEATKELNKILEEEEVKRKDELKMRREGGGPPAQLTCTMQLWACSEQDCNFVGRNKAGLVNHTRQRHRMSAQAQHSCPHCGDLFHKQGLVMHKRFCRENPNRQRKKRLGGAS